MRFRSGFTLIELMVVIAIIGVMVIAAVPAVSSFLPGYRLNTSSREVMVNLAYARTMAVRNNVRCVVVFMPPSNYMAFLDTNGNWEQDNTAGAVDTGEETVMTLRSMPSGVTIVSAVFSNNEGATTSSLDTNGDGTVETSDTSAQTSRAGFDSHGLASRSAASGAFVFGTITMRNTENKTALVGVTPAGQTTLSTY